VVSEGAGFSRVLKRELQTLGSQSTRCFAVEVCVLAVAVDCREVFGAERFRLLREYGFFSTV